MTDLLTPDDVARKLAKPRSYVVALSRGGSIPHVRLGREYRYDPVELDAWIEARKAYTPPDGAATTPGQRGGQRVRGARKAKAVGRRGDGGLEPRRPPDPKGALRIVRARGADHAA